MANEALDPGASYGYLAFDIFLMEHWDHAADPAKDPEQWESAVHAYLALTARERFPYHEKAWQRTAQHYQYQFEPELAARLFTPYQTPRERNMTARRAATDCPNPVLVRTCYRPELEVACASLTAPFVNNSGGDGLVDPAGPLDDAGLYGSCEGDWSRVLLRIPELCDVIRFSVMENHEEREQDIEEAEDGMDRLSMTVATTLYEVDAEAAEEGWVKVLWLNCHGECVWYNRVRDGEILQFTGACWALVLMNQILDGYAESMEKGARLAF